MTTRRRVKLTGGVAIFLMAGVLCGFTAEVSGGSPYNGIVERNVFGLHALASSVVENPIATPVIPKVTLTGITTILGRKVAFITIASAKPGEPGEFLMLAEGQSNEGLEVKEIDAKTGHVKVEGYGREMALNFD